MSALTLNSELFEEVTKIKKVVTNKYPFGLGDGVPASLGNLLAYFTYIADADILEIGCGASSGFIYPCLKKQSHFYTIDNDPRKLKYIQNQFSTFLPEKLSQVTFIESDSRWANLEGVHFDLLWIDGDHSFAGITNDLFKFLPSLNINGMIVVHDLLNPAYPFVTLTCDFLRSFASFFGLNPYEEIVNFDSLKILGTFVAQKRSNDFAETGNFVLDKRENRIKHI